ncbi:MAG: AAA family ATPase [Candidatus Babeliales bacterium]
MKISYKKYKPLHNAPLLHSIELKIAGEAVEEKDKYPFCVPIIHNFQKITFTKPVTFFVGENGTGKSTLLEAIAYQIGFGPEGGSKNIAFSTTKATAAQLGRLMKLTWNYKPMDGYFFRAETFFNIASYLDAIDGNKSYGGKSLHHQSHGESFLSFFKHRLDGTGIYIFDEPEASLSPQCQLALLNIIHNLTQHNTAQCIIATHSPILLAYPGATIYSCDGDRLKKIEYTQTDHYQITKRFLNDPHVFFKQLFS